MNREAPMPYPIMKPVRKSQFPRPQGGPAPLNSDPESRRKTEERKERLVLLAIAVLFVANVVLYLCHHYGLTSLNVLPPHGQLAPRVIVD